MSVSNPMKQMLLAVCLFSVPALAGIRGLPSIDQLYDPISDQFAQPHFPVGLVDDLPTLAHFIELSSWPNEYDKINVMINGTAHTCLLPPHNVEQREPVTELSNSTISKARDVLDLYFGAPPMYYHSGYWAYEYRAGERIRQAHPEDSKDGKVLNFRPDNTYHLGNYTGFVPVPVRLQSRWAMQIDYDQGDYCKLISAPRSTSVYLICDPRESNPTILDLVEYQTCTYEITVALPELCRVEDFQPVLIPQNPVMCVPQAIYEAYEARSLSGAPVIPTNATSSEPMLRQLPLNGWM